MVYPFLTVKEILRKLGGDKISGKKYVLPETKVEPSEHTTEFGVNGAFILPMFVLEEGKNYKIAVDGVVVDYCSTEFATKFIGNEYLQSGVEQQNNGEPWLVVSAPNLGVCAVAFLDPAENEKPHTVAVYEETETIVPIDQKYLTKVVDLTKYDAGGNSLNDVVLGLFSSGGGKTSVSKTAGTDAFWHDVSDGRSIRFLIDAMSVKILANANSFTFESDGATVVAIETSFLIINGGSTFRVTVLLGYGSEMEITVAVEPVTVPGA